MPVRVCRELRDIVEEGQVPPLRVQVAKDTVDVCDLEVGFPDRFNPKALAPLSSTVIRFNLPRILRTAPGFAWLPRRSDLGLAPVYETPFSAHAPRQTGRQTSRLQYSKTASLIQWVPSRFVDDSIREERQRRQAASIRDSPGTPASGGPCTLLS